MKTLSFLLLSCCLSINVISCYSQKMVQKPSESHKLQTNKDKLIGRYFEELLNQIVPDVKYAFGSPDGSSLAGTVIKLFFVAKEEYKVKGTLKPIGVLVSFYPEVNNKRAAIPKGRVNISKKELIKEYGSMIVRSIYVTGKD